MQRLFRREKSLTGLYVQSMFRENFLRRNKICARTDMRNSTLAPQNFESDWDAEVVSTIEKTPGTVHRQYIPGVFIWVGHILIRKFRDRPECGGGSGHKKGSGRVHSSTSHSLFDGHGCILASRGM